MTRGVCSRQSRHCFDRIDSVRVDRQAGLSLLLFFLVKFQLALPVWPSYMIRAGRSHRVEDYGNNTLSVLFKLKLEQMSCSSVDPKHCVSFSARRPFESPQFTKISCKPGHGLSRKKKHAAELPVSQGTERMRLVLSSS